MFWEVGKYIGSFLPGGERAGYGKQILVTASQELQTKYMVIKTHIASITGRLEFVHLKWVMPRHEIVP